MPVRSRVRRRRLVLAACVFPLAAAACSSVPEPGVPRTASATQVSERLFFGRSIPGGGAVTDRQWEAFLRDVITPRFPQGLTVWRAEGQWLEAGGVLAREPVMIVEVVHAPGPELERALEEIGEEYKRRFGQEAVLRATSQVRTRLYDE